MAGMTCLLQVSGDSKAQQGCVCADSSLTENAAQESAAARVALLAVTILTGLIVFSVQDKDPKLKPLLAATWRVCNPTQLLALISN